MKYIRILLGLSLAGGVLFGADETVTYAYDGTGRLTGAAYSSGTTLAYAYDAAGNILERRVAQAQALVSFLVADGAGTELVSPVLVTVTLSPPAAEAVTVQYACSDGSATGSGADFSLVGDGMLVFAPGETQRDILVAIINDDQPEGSETVQIVLQNPTTAELGPPGLFTYTIRDEDTDDDTLSDDWERAAFGDLVQGPEDDPDGDGASNALELASGTEPDERMSAPGPVGWWRFDEGSGMAVTDSSGNAVDGTVSGAVWAAGVLGSALRFDGTGDVVSVNGAESLSLHGFTLSAWLSATPADAGTVLASRAGAGGDGYRLEIVDDGSRQLRGTVQGDASGEVSAVFTTADVADGAWHHVAFTRDPVSRQLVLYIDGELQTTGADLSLGAAGTAGELLIGASPGKASRFFAGLLDEVRVYGYARSAAVIAIEAGQYTLTYQAGDNGSVTGTLVQSVVGGGDGAPVTAVPDPGYVFDHWSDGSEANPRADTGVSADITVAALFRPAAPALPEGPFTARLAAAGVLAGRGLWDLSGTYTATVVGQALVMNLVHDSRGRISGNATYTVAKGTVVALPVKGSVRGSSGGVLLKGTLKGAAPDKTVSLALELALAVDTAAGTLTGPLTGSVRIGDRITVVNDALELPIAAPMDGTWALQFHLHQAGRAIAGSARLVLSNGAGCGFLVRGQSSGTTALLTLSGDPADPAAKAIRIRAGVTPREDGTADLGSVSARAYGQALAW